MSAVWLIAFLILELLGLLSLIWLIFEFRWAIRDILRPRARSATLNVVECRTSWINHLGGLHRMPATIKVGGTATAVYKEWTGPDGTGSEIPPLSAPSFSSSDPTVASVDGNGLVTGVGAGSATITGTDHLNSLSGTDTVTVEAPPPPPTAVSATLVVTAN